MNSTLGSVVPLAMFDYTAFPDVEDDELQLALAVSMSLDQKKPPQQVKPEGKI